MNTAGERGCLAQGLEQRLENIENKNYRQRETRGGTNRQMKVQSQKTGMFFMGGYTGIFQRMGGRNAYIMNTVNMEVFEHGI